MCPAPAPPASDRSPAAGLEQAHPAQRQLQSKTRSSPKDIAN